MRERIGLSQTDLAKKVGISQSAIPKYESGKQIPSYEIGIKLFEVLQDADLELSPEVWEIMTSKVRTISSSKKFVDAIDIMNKESISQIPVVKGKQIVGTVSESMALNLLDKYHSLTSLKEAPISEIMEEILPTVPKSCKLMEISPLLKRYSSVLVLEKGELIGIVTKANLFEM